MRVFGGSLAASQSLIADDSAANYTSFSNGSISPASGGYGFNNWVNAAQGNGGIFRGAVASGFGNINSSGNSFGAYGGNTSGATDGVNIQRNLNNPLSVGFALSSVMATQFRSGSKGFSAYTSTDFGGTPGSEVFNVNVGGDQYQIDNVNQGDVLYSSDMIISITLRQITTTTFEYIVNFRGTQVNNVNVTKTNTKTGVIRGYKWYVFETSITSPNDPNNLYFNNIDVYRY